MQSEINTRPKVGEVSKYEGTGSDMDQSIATLEKLSTWLDSSFSIPGTNIKFGWDGIIGLIPGIGDTLGFLPLGYYLKLAHKYGLGKRVYLRLVFNQFIDFLIGTIPLVGDLFDIGFKANLRNARLISERLKKERGWTA